MHQPRRNSEAANMRVRCLHQKDAIEAFLQRDPFLHLYEIGDLDEFFWEHTTWYALKNVQSIQQLALLYTGSPLPVLIALTRENSELLEQLLRSLLHLLPRRFYAHFTCDIVRSLADDYHFHSHGLHYKMGLIDRAPVMTINASEVTALSLSDCDELMELYRTSYPSNWFEPRMLETGQYYGIRREQRLVAVAGVHVYSPQYQIAALGNVTVHPKWRQQGLGTLVCARLCQALIPIIKYIGLNVKADNIHAIRCYERLGFQSIATYEELLLNLKSTML